MPVSADDLTKTRDLAIACVQGARRTWFECWVCKCELGLDGSERMVAELADAMRVNFTSLWTLRCRLRDRLYGGAQTALEVALVGAGPLEVSAFGEICTTHHEAAAYATEALMQCVTNAGPPTWQLRLMCPDSTHEGCEITRARLDEVFRLAGEYDRDEAESLIPKIRNECALALAGLRDHVEPSTHSLAGTPDEVATRNRGNRQAKLAWLASAMLTVNEHPDWPDVKIAGLVGRTPGTLSRCAEYKAAAKLARGNRALLRRGHVEIDPETGDRRIEAYD